MTSTFDDSIPGAEDDPHYDDLVAWMEAIGAAVDGLSSAVQDPQSTSTTSASIGTGSKGPFTLVPSTRLYAVDDVLRIEDAASAANFMIGTVTAAGPGSVTVTVASGFTGGSGTKTAWIISRQLVGVLPAQVANAALVSDGTNAAFKRLLLPTDQSGAYTVTTADHYKLINVTTAGTQTLPAAATAGAGFLVAFRNGDTAAYNVDGNSTETINGAQVLRLQPGDSAILVSTGSAWLAIVERKVVVPKNTIVGLTMSNNGSDATNDVDFTAFAARDDTDAYTIHVAALTKRLDAAWSAGTNQGGLDTGAIANTTYFPWAIYNPTTGVSDILLSASASAPTMPSGYTLKAPLPAILRESAAIVGFVHTGIRMRRKVPVKTHQDSNPGTSSVTRAMAVPVGRKVRWLGSINVDNGSTANLYGLTRDLAMTDTAPTQDLNSFAAEGGTGTRSTTPAEEVTNTSAQIAYRLSGSGVSDVVRLFDRGWEEIAFQCVR